MVNLLPPAAKNAIKREYWIRVATVACVTATLCVGVVFFLQVPTYVLLTSQLNGFETRFKEAQTEKGVLQQVENEVKDINALAKHLGNIREPVFFSDYVRAIESLTSTDITLSSFDGVRVKGKIEKIQIRGVAGSRSSLAQFSEDITNSPLFFEAKLPIENLARDKNIDFELTVIPLEP